MISDTLRQEEAESGADRETGVAGPPRSSQNVGQSGLFSTAQFMIWCYKILPCNKRSPHSWQKCPYSHHQEKAKRRDLRLHYYTSRFCPDARNPEGCPRGDDCIMAHNVHEALLHPERFRTQICSAGAYCQRRICWFAHAAEELRYPGSLSDQTPAQQQAMAAAAVAEIGRKGCAPAAAAAAAAAAGVGTRCTAFKVSAFGQCPDEVSAHAGAAGVAAHSMQMSHPLVQLGQQPGTQVLMPGPQVQLQGLPAGMQYVASQQPAGQAASQGQWALMRVDNHTGAGVSPAGGAGGQGAAMSGTSSAGTALQPGFTPAGAAGQVILLQQGAGMHPQQQQQQQLQWQAQGPQGQPAFVVVAPSSQPAGGSQWHLQQQQQQQQQLVILAGPQQPEQQVQLLQVQQGMYQQQQQQGLLPLGPISGAGVPGCTGMALQQQPQPQQQQQQYTQQYTQQVPAHPQEDVDGFGGLLPLGGFSHGLGLEGLVGNMSLGSSSVQAPVLLPVGVPDAASAAAAAAAANNTAAAPAPCINSSSTASSQQQQQLNCTLQSEPASLAPHPPAVSSMGVGHDACGSSSSSSSSFAGAGSGSSTAVMLLGGSSSVLLGPASSIGAVSAAAAGGGFVSGSVQQQLGREPLGLSLWQN